MNPSTRRNAPHIGAQAPHIGAQAPQKRLAAAPGQANARRPQRPKLR